MLYVLYRLSPETNAVRALIAALTDKIEQCPRNFENVDQAEKAVASLEGITSEVPEVLRLFAVLTPKIPLCTDDTSTSGTERTLHRLKMLNSKREEVLQFMAALERIQYVRPEKIKLN